MKTLQSENRIVVFGGSFDPPHIFHIKILKSAISRIKPYKTIIIPAYISPFKEGHFAEYFHRKEMIKILFKKYKINAEIDDFEYNRKKKTYTYEIGRYLKKKYPSYDFYFLMGSDSFNSIKKWKRYREVLKTFKVIVAVRRNYPLKNECKDCIILKPVFKDISSTDIRKSLFVGDYTVVDDSIRKYIIKNNLYFSHIIRVIKKLETEKRFIHSLSVAELAIELAEIYDVDITKTVLAALLHDITKDFPIEDQIRIIKKAGVKIKKIDSIIKHHRPILHQYSASAYIRYNLGITDPEILSAVSKHTTGDKRMSLLDKIIYVSDFSSKDRRFKYARFLRELAKKDIDRAYLKARKFKVDFIRKNNMSVYE